MTARKRDPLILQTCRITTFRLTSAYIGHAAKFSRKISCLSRAGALVRLHTRRCGAGQAGARAERWVHSPCCFTHFANNDSVCLTMENRCTDQPGPGLDNGGQVLQSCIDAIVTESYSHSVSYSYSYSCVPGVAVGVTTCCLN